MTLRVTNRPGLPGTVPVLPLTVLGHLGRSVTLTH